MSDEVPADAFRVGNSRPKRNTCAPRSAARLYRAEAGIKRHLEANPNDAAARQRLSNLQERIRAS